MNNTLEKVCKADIDVCIDKVIVFRQALKKPKSISCSEWMKFWERVKRMQVHYE